jgi:hypothetical protein
MVSAKSVNLQQQSLMGGGVLRRGGLT